MINNGVRISWDESEEYIAIDLDALDQLQGVDQTLEWWRNEGIAVRYHTESEVQSTKGGSVALVLRYAPELNSHLDDSDIVWGTSVIHLDPSAKSGKVEWYPDDEEKTELEWVRVNTGLLKEPKRKTKTETEIERLQREFRGLLLADAAKCELTGESTAEALEAAHIIPSHQGGAEVLQNGILLRADLHRLYDKEKFRIDSQGYVVGVKDVSANYKELLEGCCLDERSLNRVQDALRFTTD